jgi:hypothetical protein
LSTKHAIIVGAQRSGSTSLYEMLKQSEGVYSAFPDKPEPKCFLRKTISKEEYLLEFFPDVKQHHKLLLEKSTSYYEQGEIFAQTMKNTLEQVKCLMILRNPISRALSNYKFSKKNGLETRTLEQVFVEQTARPSTSFNTSVNPFDYLSRGEYSKYIHTYLKVFGEDLKVVLMEEMSEKNKVEELFDFLNLVANTNANFPSLNSSTNDLASSEVIEALKCYYKDEISLVSELLNKDLTFWTD